MPPSTRRQDILSATIDLLARQGLPGVTRRAVDAAAGLLPGSTSYCFPRKAALLAAASDHRAEVLGRECDEVQIGFARHVADDGTDAAVAHVGREEMKCADDARRLFVARIELALAGARDPALGGIGRRLTEAARRPLHVYLTLLSGGAPSIPVETCAALIDSITLMHVTEQGTKPTLSQVTAVLAAGR